MPKTAVKNLNIEASEEKKAKKGAYTVPEPFSKECFTRNFPLTACDGDDTPMWWKIVRKPGITFKQYKKDKKRAEKERAQLEEYVRSLEAVSEKYSLKLKEESAKYKLECEMRDYAFEEKRKQEELLLSAEREKSRQRLLEEQIASQNKLLEYEKALEEEKMKKREIEANEKFELKKAKIAASEKAERERILAEEEAEKVRMESLQVAERKKEERRERERELKRRKLEAEMLDMEEANAEKVRLAELEAQKQLEEEERLSRELALREEESEKELKERERIRNAHRENRLKRQEEEQKRAELARVAEKKTVEQLRKAHKIKDVEFVYPYPVFGEKSEDVVLELSNVMLKMKKSKKAISSPVSVVVKKGLNVTVLAQREMKAVCSSLKRDFDKDKMMSGGIRFDGEELSHEIGRKQYVSLSLGRYAIVDYEAKKLYGLGSVCKYVTARIGADKLELATDYLQRLNVHSAKSLIKKRASSCSVGEVARILIVCALLSSSKVAVLCEPQRCMDMPARSALRDLVLEWQGGEDGRALWIITQDEELYK